MPHAAVLCSKSLGRARGCPASDTCPASGAERTPPPPRERLPRECSRWKASVLCSGVPIRFELDAATLAAAVEKFGAAAEQAVHQTMRELQEMRREQASSLVIPDAAGAALPNPSDLLGRGRPRR